MSSIQELRRIALELERSKNVGNLDDDTTTENVDEFGNPLFDGDMNANQNNKNKRTTGAPLLSYDALVALYQSDIDVIETEIHTIVTSLENSRSNNSSATSSSSPSELLSAWLKLINTHQTIANEATRLVKENGAMDPELIATFVSSTSQSNNAGKTDNQQPQEGQQREVASSESSSPSDHQNGSDHQQASNNNSNNTETDDKKAHSSPRSLEKENNENNADDDDDFNIDGGGGGGGANQKRRISFVNNAPTAVNPDEGVEAEKAKGAQGASTSATASPHRPLPTLSLAAKLSSTDIPTLLTDAYNRLNIVYERAIRSMTSDTVLFLHETTAIASTNNNTDDDTAAAIAASAQKERAKSSHATTTITTVSPTTLLSLLLFRKDGAGSPKSSGSEGGGEAAVSQQPMLTMMGSLKLWRMYIGARTSQALFLRLNLKRVLYPLFDRALIQHGIDASSATSAAPVVSVGPAGLRLWLDYCDLCMLLADFTKLRVVLQQAFERMPSAAIHTRLWQYVRHRIFCLSGSANSSSSSSAKKKGNNPSEEAAVPDGMTLLTKKMISDSVILSAISKYNESLYTHFSSDVTEAINKAVGVAETEAVETDENDDEINSNNNTNKKAFLLRGIKLAAAKYTSSVSVSSSSSSTSSRKHHQHHQRRDHPAHPLALPLRYACSAATPQSILALFWGEYIRAFPTQRTLNEYLSFLSMSVHTAVANYHTLVSKLQEQQRRALQAAKRRERSAGHANNAVDKEEAAVVVALSDELTHAKSKVASATNNYMNFLMEKAFNKQTPAAKKGAATAGVVDTTATSTTNISVSVNFETWETISFVLQNLNIVTSSSSSAASVETLNDNNNTLAMLNRADVRRWIEAVIGGLERAEFESNKSINRLASSGIVNPPNSSSSGVLSSSSSSSSSVLATISPVHVKAKIDILLSCAVALAHFSLFDEAFELLWEYAIKNKGSFDQIEIFQKLFNFTCRMLQTLATQSVAVLEQQQLQQQGQGQPQKEERSLSCIAETAVRRLTMITAEYDRLRLNLSLRIDRRNVNAWIERVAMYRDAFEEKRPVASAAAIAAAAATNGLAIGGDSAVVNVETMKNVYMTAIQALSSLASSSTTATTTGSSIDALLFAGGNQPTPSSSNRQAIPSSSFSTEALSAVIDLYDEYANFIYYTVGDYESLRNFLRKSVLSADFGAEEDGAADEEDDSSSSSSSGSDDDGEDEKDEENNANDAAAAKDDESSAAAKEETERKKKLEKLRKMKLKKAREEEKRRAREFKQHQKEQRMIKGAKGIRVNIRLFGMLLDITLAHAGPAAARDLLLSWVNSECPLPTHRQPSDAAASSTKGNKKRPSSLSASLPSSAVGATDEENKKRERDYYRHLSNRGVNARLKQRRAELLASPSSSGEGGGSTAAVLGLGSVGGGSGGGGLRGSPIASKLWLSEEMWDLCLHFASLIDRQNELIESKNYSTTTTTKDSTASSAAAPKVWAKCVTVGMASPWLSMRVVTRLLSAAGGATNLPIHIIGKTSAAKKTNNANGNNDTDTAAAAADDTTDPTASSESSSTILAKASESIPNSLFFTSPDWSSLSALTKKFSSTAFSSKNGIDGSAFDVTTSTSSATTTTTSFELFGVDPSLPLSIIRKQLTATRDALAALSSALSVSTDPIAIATLALWRINLQSEEARLLELVFSKLKRLAENKKEKKGSGRYRAAAASTNTKGDDEDDDEDTILQFFGQQQHHGATNISDNDGAASVLLIRESLRNTVTSSLTPIIIAGGAEGGGSLFNPNSPAATTLSAATSQLLLRYIWFESQQVPSASAAAANAGHGHDVENFVAYGTQYMPVLICPKTFLCALVKNSEVAVSTAAGTLPTIPLGLADKILCDTDRYRVLDLLMKTLVATRGIDLTLRILQKSISSTTSPADVAFLSSRLAACLVMRKDVLAARSVFDKLAPTQAKAILAMYANIGFEAKTNNTLSGNNDNDSSATTASQSHLNLPPPPHSTIQEQMKSFWATWLSFENAFGTPSTMGNVRQWYGKIMRHLGPLVVHRTV